MSFSVDELYGVDFKEFCKQTYTSPELYIKAIEAEIEMLEKNYQKVNQKFRKTKSYTEEGLKYAALLNEIQQKLKHKKRKLEKYRKYL